MTQPAPQTAAAVGTFMEQLSRDIRGGSLELPGYPDIALRVSKALRDPAVTAAGIARLVAAEPVLSARLLRTANSAALRGTAGGVKDVKSAINRLGFSLVQSATAAFAMEQMLTAYRYESHKRRFEAIRQHSVLVAAISHVLAAHVGGVNADEALLTGLMHSIGKIYVLARSQEHHELLGSDVDLDSLIAGWHIHAGEAILSRWEFPQEIVAAVATQAAVGRPAQERTDLADLLITAAPLPQVLGDEQRLRACLEVTRAPERLRSSVDDCVSVLGNATDRINDLRRSLG